MKGRILFILVIAAIAVAVIYYFAANKTQEVGKFILPGEESQVAQVEQKLEEVSQDWMEIQDSVMRACMFAEEYDHADSEQERRKAMDAISLVLKKFAVQVAEYEAHWKTPFPQEFGEHGIPSEIPSFPELREQLCPEQSIPHFQELV